MFMLGFYKSLLLLIFLGVAFLPALQWQMKVSTRKPLLKLNMRCHLGGHWNPGRKPHPYMYLPKPFGEAHNFSLIYRPWRMVGTTPQNLTFRCPNVTVLEKDDSAIKRRHFFWVSNLKFLGWNFICTLEHTNMVAPKHGIMETRDTKLGKRLLFMFQLLVF